MFSEVPELVLALTPGLVGAFLGMAWAAKHYRGLHGAIAVFGGAGGVLGYVLIAIFIRTRDSLALPAFFPSLAIMLQLFLGIALIAFLAVFFFQRLNRLAVKRGAPQGLRTAFAGLVWQFLVSLPC